MQFCALPSGVDSLGHLGYDSDVSASVLNFGETDSDAAGSDGLLHPTGESHQMAYMGSAVGAEVPVGTAPGESLF